MALKRKFVVLQADITTERRLQGSGGQPRSLFAELMKNLATASRPEGGALPNLIERWVGDIEYSITGRGGTDDDIAMEIGRQLEPVRELVSGYDFTRVLTKYFEGHHTGNDALMQSALRWLRAEYSTKTEARQDLGVRSIIDDADFYDALKLLAAFVTKRCNVTSPTS